MSDDEVDPGSPRPVLIASGSEETSALMNTALHSLGLRVEVARTGVEALERVSDAEYSILFVCTSIRDPDAYELVRLIHGDRSMRHLPKIMLTGSADAESVLHRAYAVGCLDCLIMPTRQGVLRAKVQALIAMQRARDEALARAARWERSNGDFAQLAHAAAHDLRAPIRTIRGFAELLKQRLVGPISGHADVICNVSARLDRMLGDMLEYANVESVSSSLETVDLARSVETAFIDFRSELRAMGGQLKHGPLPIIIGSRSQWIRVFQNLLSNAMKYARPGIPPQIRIRASLSNGRVEIRVSDNGTGFDMSRHDEVFQPFRRLVATENSGGAGIGLATVRRIIERHHGTICAESEVGVGTSFIISVPITPFEAARFRRRSEPAMPVDPLEIDAVSPPGAAPILETAPEGIDSSTAAPPGAPPGPDGFVLVVDDSEPDRLYAATLMGRRAVLADSAERALELLGPGVEVLVTDYQMPDHNGLWLLSRVAERAPAVRRFLMSSSPDAKCQEAVRNGEAEGVFTKPLSADDIALLRNAS